MRFAVIGGGITGLVAAHELKGRGHEVRLFEREERFGGKIRTDRRGDLLIEAGPDSFLTRDPEILDLCRALGLGSTLLELTPPRRVYIYGRGGLHALPRDVRITPTRWPPIARSGLFSPLEKLRIAAERWVPKEISDGDTSLGELVARRFGTAALDRLTAPLIAGIYAADPFRLSTAATFPELLDRARRGSLLAAGPGPGGARFLSFEDGMETLVRALVAELGKSSLRPGVAVDRIEARGGEYRVMTEGATGAFDGVVVTVPTPSAGGLVGSLAPEARSELDAIDYVSTAVVTAAYRGRDLGLPEGHGFVVARDQPAPITASSWSSSKWSGRAPEGVDLVRVFLGSAERPVDLCRDDAVLVDEALGALCGVIGARAEPFLAEIARWPRAMPQYHVRHLERVARIERALADHPRIAVAGAGYRGIGISRCVAQAIRAAAIVER